MKQIHRKNSTQNTDASLFLFDTLPLEDFKKGIYETTLEKRMCNLKKFIKNIYQKVKKLN